MLLPYKRTKLPLQWSSATKECTAVMTIFSVLDLSPICEGDSAREAIKNSVNLARETEKMGYYRYWLAEHHNMKGIASAATSLVIGHVAEHTTKIRVGSGGIMLPNHAPMIIAEQFGTLEALYPGRIDLGLGRAPGTDGLTAQALRRTLNSDPNNFPKDVLELKAFLSDPIENQPVCAVPGYSSKVPIYILGSSLFGAQLAAILGFPFAFASHFAPDALENALEVYRSEFQPSEQLKEPYVMLGFNICAADHEEEAKYLKSSGLQALINLRSGKPGPLPPPIRNFEETLCSFEKQLLSQSKSASATGDIGKIREEVSKFLKHTGADELIITSQIFDHSARVRSYEIANEACQGL